MTASRPLLKLKEEHLALAPIKNLQPKEKRKNARRQSRRQNKEGVKSRTSNYTPEITRPL